jgi:hypothetical protein
LPAVSCARPSSHLLSLGGFSAVSKLLATGSQTQPRYTIRRSCPPISSLRFWPQRLHDGGGLRAVACADLSCVAIRNPGAAISGTGLSAAVVPRGFRVRRSNPLTLPTQHGQWGANPAGHTRRNERCCGRIPEPGARRRFPLHRLPTWPVFPPAASVWTQRLLVFDRQGFPPGDLHDAALVSALAHT